MVHLRIPVWSARGWSSAEEVEVRDLGHGRFLVLCPPRFAHGIAAGDEIALEPDAPSGFRVFRHGGNLTVWVYSSTEDSVVTLVRQATTLLEPIGAVLEGTPGGMLIITVPVSSGWTQIGEVMDELCSSDPGASWEFGNVYRVEDGVTPLDWWDELAPAKQPS
jgi:hypothetical protein